MAKTEEIAKVAMKPSAPPTRPNGDQGNATYESNGGDETRNTTDASNS